MSVSRSPVEFMRRNGLEYEPESPGPRLCLDHLLVLNIPVAVPPQATLVDYEGDPIPDRGSIRPWPYQ